MARVGAVPTNQDLTRGIMIGPLLREACAEEDVKKWVTCHRGIPKTKYAAAHRIENQRRPIEEANIRSLEIHTMPIQAPQWTEFLSCPVCYNVFNETLYRPISLACGHTVCRSCLGKLQQRKCPFDQSLISRDVQDLPVNFALLQLVCATAAPESKKGCVPEEFKKFYDSSQKCVEDLALLLKPVSSSSTGSIISVSTSNTNSQNATNSVLSRPMQRKLITLVNCQLVEEEGRGRAVRAARSLGERTVTELILQHQNPQQLSSNLWASVRGRGCQFLGPAMQEEVLKLILLALEDGSALSRKVLVLFVVQRLETHFPQASKTAIGHVVQLLYRASCFKVTKRDEESSLMQLKEEFRTYDTLRREHDSQIVQIAMEAGLRIAPDQWSSLLYGDATHKSHMQSIIDKLQTPQTFSQSVSELLLALQRTEDPHNLQRLGPELEFLSSIDPSPDIPVPSWENLDGVMKAIHTVVEGLVEFLQNAGPKKHEYMTYNARYKTSMCRDYSEKKSCPRGTSCTFAHSEEELERYRYRNKRGFKGPVSGPHVVGQDFHREPPEELDELPVNYRGKRQDVTHILQSLNVSATSGPTIKKGPGEIKYGAPNSHFQDRKDFQTRKVDKEPNPREVTMTRDLERTPQISVSAPPAVRSAPHNPSNVAPASSLPTMNAQEKVMTSGGGALVQREAMTPPTSNVQNMGMMQNQGQMANMNMQQGLMPGLGQSQNSSGVPPNPGMMQMGQPPNMGAPPNMGMMPMGAMQGMYPPFMPPFGGAGPMMNGPRFPIHPMMYHGQYPYMQPYMPYYPQGYLPSDSTGRLPYDNYYTSLNPFAEPWNPGSAQRPPMGQGMMYQTQDPVRTGQSESCAVCSQRQQEEQRLQLQQRQKNSQDEGHICQLHSPVHQGQGQNPEDGTYPDSNEAEYRGTFQENVKVTKDFDTGGQNEMYKQRQRSGVEKTEGHLKEVSGQGQLWHQGHHTQGHKPFKGQYNQKGESYGDEFFIQQNGQKGHGQTDYRKGQSQTHYNKDQHQNKQYESQYDHYYEHSDSYNNGKMDSSPYRNTDQAEHVDQHGWSTSDDADDYDNEDHDNLHYQHQYEDFYSSQMGPYSESDHYQRKVQAGRFHSQSTNQQMHYGEKHKEHEGRSQKWKKKPGKVPILVPTEPNAQLHRQSLKNLQQRRDTLLAQLQELNREFEGHYGDENEMLEEIWNQDSRKLEEKGINIEQSLPDLFRPQYEFIQVDESDAYAQTLEHPHPLDVGPVSLKAELLSNGDIFDRLGAISGVPPRSVNDSIMTSWMTATLNNKKHDNEDYSYETDALLDETNVEPDSIYTSPAQSIGKSSQTENISVQTRKSSDDWKNVDKDFPYWKDVISNLESPLPTPPTTPKPTAGYQSVPLPSHQSSVVGTYDSSFVSVSASGSSRPYVSSSYMSNNYMSSSHSSFNPNSSSYSSSKVSSCTWDSLHSSTANFAKPTQNHGSTVIYNSVASYDEQEDFASNKAGFMLTDYGPKDSFWTTNQQTTAYDSSSPMSNFSADTTCFFNEDHIPFVEGAPTISKFGPISRVTANKQAVKSSGLLKAVADETVKTIPVTAVTPIEGPPLPNASTVPSRFTHDNDGHYTSCKAPTETTVTFDKVYSLWASEVNILEQKAKDASTEDEKLSVKLQAVEMQITLKQQELKQAQTVNLNSSEYMKRELNNTT